MFDSLSPNVRDFVNAYVACGNAGQAYAASHDTTATPTSCSSAGCRLLQREDVKEAVSEIREQLQDAALYGLLDALDEYEEARTLAHSEGQAGAAVSAVTGKVNLLGLSQPAKKTIDHTNSDGSLAPQSPVSVYQLPDNGRDGAD